MAGSHLRNIIWLDRELFWNVSEKLCDLLSYVAIAGLFEGLELLADRSIVDNRAYRQIALPVHSVTINTKYKLLLAVQWSSVALASTSYIIVGYLSQQVLV